MTKPRLVAILAIVLFVLVGSVSFGIYKVWTEQVRGSELGRTFFPVDRIETEDLREWGDEVDPRLREIANSGEAESIQYEVYRYLLELDRPDCNSLIVEILAGETRVDAENALTQFHSGSLTVRTTPSIFALDDFKQAVLGMASSESQFTRSHVAEYIGDLGWNDSVAVLRELLRDQDLTVKENAAESIKTLTGEVIKIDRPKASFRTVALRNDLLTKHRMVNGTLGTRYTFTSYARWFDGAPCRVITQEEELVAVNSDDSEIDRLDLGGDVRECRSLPLPDGSLQLLVGVRFGHEVASFNEAGLRLWSRDVELEETTIQYSTNGAEGIIVRGDDRWVHGLDLNGVEQWRIEISHVIYGLYSHRDLPNLFMSVNGGDAVVCQTSEQGAKQVLTIERRGIYFGSGLLLPDDQGEACILIEGERHDDSVPLLMAFDLNGARQWITELPAPVRNLVILEPPGSPKLIALLTDIGTIYIFDTQGTLHYEDQVPRADNGGDYRLIGMTAGAERDGTWTLAVKDSEGTHIFVINP